MSEAAGTAVFWEKAINELHGLVYSQGLKRGLVESKRLIEVYIWLVIKCVNMIRAS